MVMLFIVATVADNRYRAEGIAKHVYPAPGQCPVNSSTSIQLNELR